MTWKWWRRELVGQTAVVSRAKFAVRNKIKSTDRTKFVVIRLKWRTSTTK